MHRVAPHRTRTAGAITGTGEQGRQGWHEREKDMYACENPCCRRSHLPPVMFSCRLVFDSLAVANSWGFVVVRLGVFGARYCVAIEEATAARWLNVAV